MMIRLSALLCALVIPTSSITWGSFDENDLYPAHGAMMLDFVEKGSPTFGFGVSCSGTLVHPRVFLTAAHCVDGISYLDSSGCPVDRPFANRDESAPLRSGPGIWVSFDKEPTLFDPSPTDLKCDSCLDVERVLIHPTYTPNFKSDVAAIILKEPVTNITLQKLAPLGLLDDLKGNKGLNKNTDFLTVGYGASYDPDSGIKHDTEYLDKRQYAVSQYKSLNVDWLGLNQHANQGNGGTCVGDSGASTLYYMNGEMVVVGVTSWGDMNCISTSKQTRVDSQENYDFINDILTAIDEDASAFDC